MCIRDRPYREGSGPPEAYEGSHKGAELTQKWLTLSAIMSDFDVIMLQEVPGTEKVMNEKIEKFAAMLDVATEEGRLWTAINSQKSGKDGQVTGPSAEVHVCFVKSPVELKKWGTLRKVGCTELDYAPLQVVVHDARFAEEADRDFVITSVHLPPLKRRDARDSQIAALLRNYAAPDTSEHRMQLPFGPNKERRQPPVHLICGDFNTYPGQDQYQMQANGFVSKIPKNAATTSGHENYDNVLVNTHANDEFLIGGGILQLKDPHNASQSQIGLSDHFPVFVEIEEVKKTRRSAPKLTVVESEEATPAPELATVKEEEEADEEATEDAVAAVVHAAMERVTEAVIQAAAKEELDQAPPIEAPPQADASTEAPPPTPMPSPQPAPDATEAEAPEAPPESETPSDPPPPPPPPSPHPEEGSAAAPSPEAAAEAEAAPEAPTEAASPQASADAKEEAPEPELTPAPAPEPELE